MATATMTATVVAEDAHFSSVDNKPLSPKPALKERKSSHEFSFVHFWKVVWGFIQDDVYGFVIPSSLFGVLGALATGARLSEQAPPVMEVLARAPLVLLFNLVNVLIFDMSNQRAPESVEEDRINKPWRPIPSGSITIDQTRQGLLFVLPAALVVNYMLGVHADALLLLIFCWYYNDMRGNDEVCRDAVIAICYTLCNKISLQIAIGTQNAITAHGYVWIATISAVALSTMHAQDLKDQEGDALRGRWTLPLFLGDQTARAIVSALVPVWSFVCTLFWGNGHYWVSLPFGLYLARRVWMKRTPQDDKKSWKLWCLWHMTLFTLPLLGGGVGTV